MTAPTHVSDRQQAATLVFIVTVRFGPDWDSNNHKKAAPCCNSSVATFRSTDGLDWRFSSMVFTFDPSTGYEEGRPNELALVLLTDNTTLWVAHVDAGDGQPHGHTKLLWATTSKDGGGTRVPARTLLVRCLPCWCATILSARVCCGCRMLRQLVEGCPTATGRALRTAAGRGSREWCACADGGAARHRPLCVSRRLWGKLEEVLAPNLS